MLILAELEDADSYEVTQGLDVIPLLETDPRLPRLEMTQRWL